MKHLAAYLLLTTGGKTSPSAEDIKSVLSAVGIDADEERLTQLISELEGKDISELIAEGSSKLASVPAGGAVAASSAAAGGAAAPAEEAKEEAKKEEEAEESDEDVSVNSLNFNANMDRWASVSLTKHLPLHPHRMVSKTFNGKDSHQIFFKTACIWRCPNHISRAYWLKADIARSNVTLPPLTTRTISARPGRARKSSLNKTHASVTAPLGSTTMRK